jgi:hypothetical protein
MVDGAERDRWWKAWTDHNKKFYGSIGLAHHTVDTNRLITFAVTMQEGRYGLGNLRKYGRVEGVGISGCGQTAGTADGPLIEMRNLNVLEKGSEHVIPSYVGLRYT